MILLAAAVLSDNAQARPACKPVVHGWGHGATAGAATDSAVENWRLQALADHGAVFDDWLKAQERGSNCVESGNRFLCRVWGKACN
jgi:hypothetical protein